ncbi:glycoside hydrolase family 13 protein [Lactobacillus helveticus]|uniref:Oligo-1,6-glucosidase 1 n=1 Tax=Lactobacillus helveticus TaxID=1587 RepID=A0A8H9F819_LACHE|nr:alpha-glucosidase [Lactobacillus helveticus]KRO13787.1 oligo-1,6-glucosidase (Sucrase-isomaltase) [Lactobacillus helveticus]MBW8061091.1 alpha-glucosidase [Lactobacillus helveticus]GFO99261.1 oligo-1,6-glucosidase 1 [Lactobacillus helveticus]GFP00239.1 oligo-1,6-glucosidase 1 [Lactobacillus helveticus]GFP03299.1 oligo-1,6-glucosidase 1 [Lactobacillus helveticus]
MKWWQKGIIYEIYPKSFYDSNGDGIGDLPGIVTKLPYLKELGVDAIWLTPIYLSPQVDNGYDVADYRKVDPMFGSNHDLERLIEQAHKNGLKIILDMVANHTSDQCVWFKESKKSRNNYFSDFYIWRDPKPDGSAPNNWAASFGGSAWTYVPERRQYYLHYYAAQQPDLNWENPLVRQYVFDAMRYWKAQGVDGWRLDVITQISKDLSFKDVKGLPGQKYVPLKNTSGPHMHQFIHELNQQVLSPFEMMSVGEAPNSSIDEILKLTAPEREELDMAFSFEHMRIDKAAGKHGEIAVKKPDFKQLKDVLSKMQTELADKAWNALYFENHDRSRIPSRWGNDKEYRYESATAFATILHGLCGTPFIFQGEEIGMTNPTYSVDEYEDIDLKNKYQEQVEEKHLLTTEEFLNIEHKIARDNGRTPMQWDTSPNAGFTQGKPWYKVNPDYKQINVKVDIASKKSIFKYYQKLIALRHQEDILTEGKYQEMMPEDKNIFAYYRVLENKRWLVVVNMTDRQIESDQVKDLIKDYRSVILHNYKSKEISATLAPYEAYIVQK